MVDPCPADACGQISAAWDSAPMWEVRACSALFKVEEGSCRMIHKYMVRQRDFVRRPIGGNRLPHVPNIIERGGLN